MAGGVFDLDTYVIARPMKFGLNLPYDCYDKDGNRLFEVKRKLIGGQYLLVDASGATIGVLHRKMMAVTPTYEFYDGSNNLLGRASKDMQIINLQGAKFSLFGSDGNKLAAAALNFPLLALMEGKLENLGYDITTPDESVSLAKIAILFPGMGYSNNAIDAGIAMQNSRFVLQITDKRISTLMLLEFAIAIDHLFHSSAGPGVVNFGPVGGTGFGNPGFGGPGGGGISFKL
jgi:hypothetical protein